MTTAGARRDGRSSTSPLSPPNNTSAGSATRPGKSIAFRAKRSGNTPIAGEPRPYGGGAKRSAATTPIARTAKASGATAARFRTGRPPWDHSSPIPSGFMTPPPTCSNGSKTAGTPPIEGRLPTAPPGRKVTAATGSSGAGLFIITPRWGGRPTGPRTRPGSKATGSVSESSGNWIRALWRPGYLTARARARWLRASWWILLSICVKLRATSRHTRWRFFNSSPLSLSSPS